MKRATFDWGIGSFLIAYQLILLLCLPFYFLHSTPSFTLIALSGFLLYATGLSITAGYHRYYSHKTYSAHPIIEWILLLVGAMGMQGSALRWSHDHRLHHAHVDTDKDPYSINKGFWYAHFLWMLQKPNPIQKTLVSDLLKNSRVVFQHRFIIPLMFGTNVCIGLVIGWMLGDYLGAFVIAVALRIFVLHHLTWFINSLAHTWGEKPFCQEQTAVNNLILSFLTFGEGYHNYHHVFAKDYRNGVRWYHFDPTKWLIWFLSKIGLTKDLRRIDPITIKKRMVLERKALLLEKVHTLPYLKQEELANEIQSISDKLVEKIANFNTLRKELHRLKQPELMNKIKEEVDQIGTSLKKDWKRWKLLSRTILQLKPPQTN